MSYRALAGLILALVASLGLSTTDLNTASQRAIPQVSLVSVSPGIASGDGEWCIGTNESVALTAHAVDLASQTELMEGTIVWQVCANSKTGLPKEDCDSGRGHARWTPQVISDLSFDSTPSVTTFEVLPLLGWRLQFRPAPGSGVQRATSESFNLDRTCSP